MVRETSLLDCFALKTLGLISYYTTLSIYIQSFSFLVYFHIYTPKLTSFQNSTKSLQHHPSYKRSAVLSQSSSLLQHPQKTQQVPSDRLISTVNSNLVFPLHRTHSYLQTNSEGRLISLSHSIFCTSQVTLTQHNIKIPG